MLRAGGTLIVLVTIALGPIYAGADYRITVDPVSNEARLATVDRAVTRARVTRPRFAAPEAPERIVRRVDVARGDTLGSLLAEAGLEASPAARWCTAAATVLDPRRFRIGRTLTIEHDLTGTLAALRYEIDDLSTVVVERVGDTLTARRETKPVTIEVRGVVGTVERGLWRDLVDAGAPPAIASKIEKVFGGRVDFRRVAVGDEFRVLYEVATQPGSAAEHARDVLGAQLRVRGRLVTAVYFEDRAGRGSYYGPDGDALGRVMLRYPLEFTRISSGFTHRRFHPILRRNRPHLGVDFAAPRGTPVRATADGTVVLAGWKRGMGRMIRVRHEQGVETFYGHLHRIASGLRSGTPVRQGQVIGYVGATGLATGNHLHYGVRQGGRFVNPMQVGSIRVAALPDGDRQAFAAVRDAVTSELMHLDDAAPTPAVVSLAPRTGSEG